MTGPQAGTSDIFIDNFPGMPDNINRDGNGLFWVTLFMVSVQALIVSLSVCSFSFLALKELTFFVLEEGFRLGFRLEFFES